MREAGHEREGSLLSFLLENGEPMTVNVVSSADIGSSFLQELLMAVLSKLSRVSFIIQLLLLDRAGLLAELLSACSL
jgi:hypothetical protein